MSSNDSFTRPYYCLESRGGLLIFTVFCVANVLLTPLFLLVLYIGWKRWRKQPSGSTMTSSSHSDVFTYNVIVLELTSTLGAGVYCYATYTKFLSMYLVAEGSFYFSSFGQSLLHVLTCVDRYLAVVHPITYLSLRHSGGVRIRNISITVVWLICFAVLWQSEVAMAYTTIIQSSALIFLLGVASFCTVSVLRVLIQPGPGKEGRNKSSVDQSKQRAFYTITAIMGALWLRFVGILFANLITDPRLSIGCKLNGSIAFLTLPGSLVLPLLFLHRAGRLPGCKCRTQSGV